MASLRLLRMGFVVTKIELGHTVEMNQYTKHSNICTMRQYDSHGGGGGGR